MHLGEPMLKIENLVTSFGSVIALDGVSLSAQEAKITTVIGANGAGKSTLLRTISGLEHPSSGTITWQGESIVGRRPEDIVRMGIAHVPEGHAVISELSVEENITMGSLFRRRKFKSDVPAATEEMYTLFPRLKERRKQLAGTLSGGERQMLAISRALVSRPKLLLLDEATSSLDSTSEGLVQDALERASNDRTTIIIAHRLSTIQNVDCIFVFRDGRVVERGKHDYLLSLRGVYFNLVQQQSI